MNNENSSNKSGIVVFILAFFLGISGVHYFYVGRRVKGWFYFFTLGGFVVGYFRDLIKIVSNKFTDKEKKFWIFKEKLNVYLKNKYIISRNGKLYFNFHSKLN